MITSFEQFMMLKETDGENPSSAGGQNSKSNQDWRKEFIQLEKGFIPPPNMRPIINAFLESGNIQIQQDLSKPVKMPKKSLFLVGGPVRDFLKGKSIKDYDLATNATPEQTAHILHAAGFKVSGKHGAEGMSPDFDRSGKKGKELDLTFKPAVADAGDNMTWFLKGRDASQDAKPFVISAVVNGEEFEIATFRKDAKVTDGAAAVDFVDNPNEDAARRDLTINALYIELTKPDGENNKLYDPTKQGWHDIMHGQVRTVGKAEERFNEDKLRVMRAIRFHCRFGKGSTMHKEIEQALPRFKSLRGVALERVREEFLKGLLHPDIDPKCYLSIYKRTGLLEKVFGRIDINIDVPSKFRDRRDKPLALAWLLQNNDIENVEAALSGRRLDGDEEKPTGWSTQEKNSVLYLLALKEFDSENVDEYLTKRKGSGLSDDQIRNWVDMFEITDSAGRTRNSRPAWAKQVRTFADFNPDPKDHVTWNERLPCPDCQGKGGNCPTCKGRGYTKGNTHPLIVGKGLDNVPSTDRSKVVKDLNRSVMSAKFKDMLPKNE